MLIKLLMNYASPHGAGCAGSVIDLPEDVARALFASRPPAAVPAGTHPRHRPPALDGGTNAGEPSAESLPTASPDAADTIGLADILDASTAALLARHDPPLVTIAALETYLAAGGELTAIKGVRKKLAAEISEALDAYHELAADAAEGDGRT